MTQFAIPGDAFSPAEAELACAIECEALPIEGFAPLGLVLVPTDLTTSIVVLAEATGLDVDRWWAK